MTDRALMERLSEFESVKKRDRDIKASRRKTNEFYEKAMELMNMTSVGTFNLVNENIQIYSSKKKHAKE